MGVRFIKSSGMVGKVYATKEVIISAGAINSPHLLLLSGVGPKAELQKHQVGLWVAANLTDNFISPSKYY